MSISERDKEPNFSDVASVALPDMGESATQQDYAEEEASAILAKWASIATYYLPRMDVISLLEKQAERMK